MVNSIEKLVEDIKDLENQLILIVGATSTNICTLEKSLAESISAKSINLGITLAQKLACLPIKSRAFSISNLLVSLADINEKKNPIIFKNLEVLFEHSLQINPLLVLRKIAHSKVVIAFWPGYVFDDRLRYAEITHPEYRDYDMNGIVIYQI
jgi:hypothetical protein